VKFNFDLIKKHPYTVGALVIGIGLIAFVLLNSGGGGGTAAAAPSGPSAAEVQAAEAEQTNQDQITAQSNQDQFQLAYLQQQQVLQNNQDNQSFNLQMTNLADQLSVAQAQLGTQAALTEFTTNAQLQQSQAQLQAQIDINNNNNATATSQQAAFLQEQEFGIATQSALQTTLSNNQTAVAQSQIAATTQIAGINASSQEYIANVQAGVQKAQIGAQQTNGILGLIGSIF